MTKKTIGKKYRGKSKNKGFSTHLTCPEILIFFGIVTGNGNAWI
ncbi:hypothetical protein C805_02589 [Eubacterium sp. 14-2]|nr:hypothetical protein C805_02589 [Eubacterium sp. 14-2]